VRRDGFFHPVGDVHYWHRVLDAEPLLAAGLVILIGAGQAGQDQRLLAVHDVTAVELSRDVHDQIAILQRGERVCGVRRGQRQVAAEGDQHLHPAVVHRLQRPDNVQPVLVRRVNVAHRGALVEELRIRAVVDPARAVAPHTGQGPAP
jgi:hypothetical protein